MAKTTEDLALSLLRELRVEAEKHSSLMHCRSIDEVALSIGFSEKETDRAFGYLETMRLITKCSTERSNHAAEPNADGIKWIESRSRKPTTNWPMVSALVALAVFCAYVMWKLVEVATQ